MLTNNLQMSRLWLQYYGLCYYILLSRVFFVFLCPKSVDVLPGKKGGTTL